MIRHSSFPPTRRAPLDPREALRVAIARSGVEAASLSRVIRRHPSYVGRFIREGVPAALDSADHELLAAFLGTGADELGDREYWTRRAVA